MGHGMCKNFASEPLSMNPADGRGFCCYFPMPFAGGAHFTLENQSEGHVNFYYYIDYEAHASLPEEYGRFHAQYRQERDTMWFSGQEGGQATVDVLTGAYNPAGRLPVAFPKRIEDSAVRDPGHPERQAMAGRGCSKDHVAENVARFTEGIFMGYRHFAKNGIEPLFPFGFGLSYTTFAYEGLFVSGREDGGFPCA